MKFFVDLIKKIPNPLENTEGLSREEIRKRRKKMEQMQVYCLVGTCALLVLIVLIVGIKIVVGGKDKGEKASQIKNQEKVQASETASADSDGQETASAAEQVAAATAAKEEEVKEEEPDESAILDEAIAGYIENMSLEEKVAALFFVTPEQLMRVNKAVSAGGATSEALSEYPVGGILFSEKNIVDGDQFLQMVSNTRTYCRYETFLGIADEGGSTSPFSTKNLIEEPSMSQKEIGANGGVADAYSSGIAYGTRLRSFGLDVNFAPVADVTLEKNATIAKRSYGSDVENVAALAKNTMKGMMDQSIHSVVKYFPSYGDVRSDGSTGKVSSKRTLADLQNTEFPIYKQLIDGGAEMIMVSVVSMPEVTSDATPACFSDVIVTDLLRGELGYDGIILTDYVSKSAISRVYKQQSIAVQAILAGCDMIVSPSNFKQEYDGVIAAVEDGTITEERLEESIYRIYRVKYKNLVSYENE